MKLLLSLIFLILITIISCTNQTETTIASCSNYCNEKGFIEGECFDCVHLIGIKLPDECKSPSFFYNDITLDICTERILQDNTQHGCLCH